MEKLRVAVLISGRGSNLQALIDACAEEDFPARIVVVISNTENAMGLERAERAEIPTKVIQHQEFADRAEFEAALERTIQNYDANFICLAGFMRLLTSGFVDSWHDRLINIHPSLLPSFRGLDTHARALAAGIRFSGCSVHFVRSEVDAGPIIVQAAVPVHPDDTPDTLAARILTAEHRCYPLALRWIADGRVTVEGDVVRVAGARVPKKNLVNPGEH